MEEDAAAAARVGAAWGIYWRMGGESETGGSGAKWRASSENGRRWGSQRPTGRAGAANRGGARWQATGGRRGRGLLVGKFSALGFPAGHRDKRLASNF